MLGVAYAFRQLGYTPPCDLWFVATSREEGLGNLDGMRMAFETLQPKLRAVLNVEGLAYGYVYHAGIAVRRLKVTTTAQGGHSWLHFGRASATHALMDVGARINRVRVPAAPRTTYNIGIIEGGHSINSIATEASLWLDLRSESTDELATLEARVMREINAVKTGEIEVAVEIVGDRPAGYLVPTHPLVQGALAALEEHGARGTLQKGSTDGNIPLAAGFPTVTIGVTRGGNAHREDEFIELEPVTKGMRQLVLLTMATATTELANP